MAITAKRDMLERSKSKSTFGNIWTPYVLLGAGVALLGCAASWRSLFGEPPNEFYALSIVGGGWLSVVLMIAWAILTPNTTRRWAALSLAALVLLGFSCLLIYSLGLITGPIGIALLSVSLFKLIVGRTKKA